MNNKKGIYSSLSRSISCYEAYDFNGTLIYCANACTAFSMFSMLQLF